MVQASLPVDPRILKYTLVFVGFAVVFAYLVLAHRLKVVSVGTLVVLAAIFVGEQVAFGAFVLPVVEAGPVERAESVLVQAQRTFEIGFVAKLVLMIVELALEDTLGTRSPLRSVQDAGFDSSRSSSSSSAGSRSPGSTSASGRSSRRCRCCSR